MNYFSCLLHFSPLLTRTNRDDVILSFFNWQCADNVFTTSQKALFLLFLPAFCFWCPKAPFTQEAISNNVVTRDIYSYAILTDFKWWQAVLFHKRRKYLIHNDAVHFHWEISGYIQVGTGTLLQNDVSWNLCFMMEKK